MTADQLNAIAEKALDNQYNTLLSKLKECAKKGKNSFIITDLPTSLSRKLTQKGFVIIPVFKYKYNFFLKRKKTKHYMIQF